MPDSTALQWRRCWTCNSRKLWHQTPFLTMQMRAAFLDWSEGYTGPKFDLVLACDVLYEVSVLFTGASASLESVIVDQLLEN